MATTAPPTPTLADGDVPAGLRSGGTGGSGGAVATAVPPTHPPAIATCLRRLHAAMERREALLHQLSLHVQARSMAGLRGGGMDAGAPTRVHAAVIEAVRGITDSLRMESVRVVEHYNSLSAELRTDTLAPPTGLALMADAQAAASGTGGSPDGATSPIRAASSIGGTSAAFPSPRRPRAELRTAHIHAAAYLRKMASDTRIIAGLPDVCEALHLAAASTHPVGTASTTLQPDVPGPGSPLPATAPAGNPFFLPAAARLQFPGRQLPPLLAWLVARVRETECVEGDAQSAAVAPASGSPGWKAAPAGGSPSRVSSVMYGTLDIDLAAAHQRLAMLADMHAVPPSGAGAGLPSLSDRDAAADTAEMDALLRERYTHAVVQSLRAALAAASYYKHLTTEDSSHARADDSPATPAAERPSGAASAAAAAGSGASPKASPPHSDSAASPSFFITASGAGGALSPKRGSGAVNHRFRVAALGGGKAPGVAAAPASADGFVDDGSLRLDAEWRSLLAHLPVSAAPGHGSVAGPTSASVLKQLRAVVPPLASGVTAVPGAASAATGRRGATGAGASLPPLTQRSAAGDSVTSSARMRLSLAGVAAAPPAPASATMVPVSRRVQRDAPAGGGGTAAARAGDGAGLARGARTVAAPPGASQSRVALPAISQARGARPSRPQPTAVSNPPPPSGPTSRSQHMPTAGRTVLAPLLPGPAAAMQQASARGLRGRSLPPVASARRGFGGSGVGGDSTARPAVQTSPHLGMPPATAPRAAAFVPHTPRSPPSPYQRAPASLATALGLTAAGGGASARSHGGGGTGLRSSAPARGSRASHGLTLTGSMPAPMASHGLSSARQGSARTVSAAAGAGSRSHLRTASVARATLPPVAEGPAPMDTRRGPGSSNGAAMAGTARPHLSSPGVHNPLSQPMSRRRPTSTSTRYGSASSTSRSKLRELTMSSSPTVVGKPLPPAETSPYAQRVPGMAPRRGYDGRGDGRHTAPVRLMSGYDAGGVDHLSATAHTMHPSHSPFPSTPASPTAAATAHVSDTAATGARATSAAASMTAGAAPPYDAAAMYRSIAASSFSALRSTTGTYNTAGQFVFPPPPTAYTASMLAGTTSKLEGTGYAAAGGGSDMASDGAASLYYRPFPWGASIASVPGYDTMGAAAATAPSAGPQPSLLPYGAATDPTTASLLRPYAVPQIGRPGHGSGGEGAAAEQAAIATRIDNAVAGSSAVNDFMTRLQSIKTSLFARIGIVARSDGELEVAERGGATAASP